MHHKRISSFQPRGAKLRRVGRRLRDSAEIAVAGAVPNWLERYLVHRSRSAFRPASNAPSDNALKRLFVDVSVVTVNDAGTGIQRVVRGVSHHLPHVAAREWEVAFVTATRHRPYQRIDPASALPAEVAPMAARPGDVFLGLDYALDAIPPNFRQLARFKQDGGRLWFFVHDLLPLQRPDWFSKQTAQRYTRWLRILASLADGFFCNSFQTEAELKQVLANRFGVHDGYRTSVLPMGADLCLQRQGDAIERRGSAAPQLPDGPYVLIVGTLEPRKGHNELLSAFEKLWATEDVGLVIVGRRGWKVEALEKRLGCHPMLGKRLFWLDDADDATLMELYAQCTGVVVAALAEGFGLPVVEALGFGKPVLARDLAVFRQHEQYGVSYFPADADGDELALRVSAWLQQIRGGAIHVKRPQFSWEETTCAVVTALRQEPHPSD